jgi:hypothetical protein
MATPANDQYDTGGHLGHTTGGGPSGGPHSGASLPFTGADLYVYVVVGLILIAYGLYLYHSSRQSRG